MDPFALVINAGSSSLKFSVLRNDGPQAWRTAVRGQIDGIGTAPRFSVTNEEGRAAASEPLSASVRDGTAAFDVLATWLRSRYGGARVLGVGHRVVHGGRRFSTPTVATPDVLAQLRELIPLAPLHQPYNIAAIEAAAAQLPGVPQVACFDTSFHRGHAPVAEVVPLPHRFH